MSMIDHNHTHQWKRVGVTSSGPGEAIAVVYMCRNCDAWTHRALTDSSRVPFSDGEVVVT